ncbi:MAG TPA: DUF1080 domain-containing protein [Opitutaceae bacterium]|nr:DUF1080 domain-containing protein [Opitutaceae bacterium]
MKSKAAFLAISALAVTSLTSLAATSPDAPIALFNGTDLSGWTAFPAEAAPPADTWKVENGVLRTTGKPNGYIRSEGRFQDYVLTVEWRWVPVAPPVDAEGRPRNRNSGVLLHMQGVDAIWPKSIEAQLMETNAGDFYVIGGVETAELVALRDAALAKAGDDEKAKTSAKNTRRVPKRQDSSENPTGEWNTYTITCRGDTVTTVVNGVEQNRATGVTVSEGHICLQSEGVPVEFRTVRLEPPGSP